jgi:hypothetical protein
MTAVQFNPAAAAELTTTNPAHIGFPRNGLKYLAGLVDMALLSFGEAEVIPDANGGLVGPSMTPWVESL